MGLKGIAKMLRRNLLAAALAAPLAGCCTPTEVDSVAASQVIDLLKQQLTEAQGFATSVTIPKGACGNGDEVVVSAIPASATVSLKTAITDSKAGSATLTVPVNLAPTAGFTFTDTDTTTQVVTFDMNVANGSPAALAADLKALKDEIKSYNDELADADTIGLTAKQITGLKDKVEVEKAKAIAVENALVQAQLTFRGPSSSDLSASAHFGGLEKLLNNNMPTQASPPVTPKVISVKVPSDVSMSAAIAAAGNELLKVDHTLRPCLKPQDIKVEFDFDVQKKGDLPVSINVLLLKVGYERTHTDERFHSIVVTYDLTQGSSAAVQ
jgi:hypothetical protein